MKKVKWWPAIIILSWIFPYLFASCVNPSTVTMPKVVDSLVYNSNLFYRGNHWGVMNDTMIYFANLPTQKQIKVFHLDGRLLRTIPLNRVLDENKIDNFYLQSLDRIVVLSHYTNTLYEIDGEGTILNKNVLSPSGNDVWEFHGSINNSAFLTDGSLVFNCNWNGTVDHLPDQSKSESMLWYYKKYWAKPLLVKVSDVFASSSKTNYTFGAPVYKYLFPSDSSKLFVEFCSYYIIGDSVFYSSNYSNKILVYNDSLDFISEHEITSDHTEIGQKMLPFGANPVDLSTLLKTSSRITGVWWDPHRRYYYISIFKGNATKSVKDKKDFQWILQIYDHDFSRLHEYVMENRDYSSFCLFVTEKGLAIRKNDLSEPVDLNHKKEVFHVFDL